MSGATTLDADVRALLTARNMAHVATLMSDGAPHVIRGRVAEEIHGEPALEIADRMSRRYTGADFPVRESIVMVIDPERVRLQELPFDH
jgi:hypothetical protein